MTTTSTPDDTEALAEALRVHHLVGGTWWDHEARTTYWKCECGGRWSEQHQAEALARIVAEKVTAAQAEGDALRARVEALAAEWDECTPNSNYPYAAASLRAVLEPKAQS